jgi:hypothetical protein
MMVYQNQDYRVFGLSPSSGILGNRKHNVLETGSVSETSCFLFPKIPDDGESKKT